MAYHYNGQKMSLSTYTAVVCIYNIRLMTLSGIVKPGSQINSQDARRITVTTAIVINNFQNSE